jgi:hypothetical protein
LTLTTHEVVGGAIVSVMPKYPALGLCLAFGSHFLLDCIPHWDYPIQSASLRPKSAAPMRYDSALLTDAITIGVDTALGMVLALFLFATQGSIALVASGALAAILPDVLQFAYTRFPHQPLASLQNFHQWIHTSNGMTKQPALGMVLQLTFLVAFAIALRTVAVLIK